MAGFGASVSLDDLERDPDPILAAMRREEPVCWVPELEMWFVTRWDDVADIESRPEVFTAATEPSFLARALGPNMLTSDPPEHTRVQQKFSPTFQPGGTSGDFVATRLVALADGLLEPLRDRFDVMSAYAQPLSAAALAEVLGLGDHGAAAVWRWCAGLCTDIANFTNDPEMTKLGEVAKVELGTAIRATMSNAGAVAGGIANFVAAGASEDEIINNVRLMISGGINEPRDGIGLVTWVLLARDDLRSAVAEDPRLMRRLVEEVYRVYTPVGTVTRQATVDVELAGSPIRAGDLVSGILRSVNLDEAHWDAPYEIRLDRREGSHAAFALGAHRCLGEWLGPQEVRVGVDRLFAAFPDLRLDATRPVDLHGFEFRGPRSLWVST